MDKKTSIVGGKAASTAVAAGGNDRRGRARPASGFRFDYGRLIEMGYAGLACPAADLVLTFRGTGMIDVFDRETWRPVAFLDFDLRREVHLDAAFRSPLIGLPFSAAFRRSQGIDLKHFEDLRRQHHYGFFVRAAYRNKGSQGIWNLDELMLAIALEYADGQGYPWFSIKPTGDTAAYYMRKFAAARALHAGADAVLHIPLGDSRGRLPHVRPAKYSGRTRYLNVACLADPAWHQG